MTHLNTEDLVDIAEGTRLERSVPHLAACESCRVQLRDLRAMMSAVQDVEVPEPSPLFWDHLSTRVREGVAAEAADAAAARGNGSRAFTGALAALLGARSVQAVVAIAAGLLVAMLLNGRTPAPVSEVRMASVADAGAAVELLDVSPDDDASLTLVASLTDDQDLETVREAGLVPRGSAEHALAHMSGGELRELGRLLQEELTRSGG